MNKNLFRFAFVSGANVYAGYSDQNNTKQEKTELLAHIETAIKNWNNTSPVVDIKIPNISNATRWIVDLDKKSVLVLKE